jgi:ATP-dependent Clp protease ATP-binding subunit ClpB
MKSIVVNQINILRERLELREVSLIISPGAVAWLAEIGYEPAFGARPLKRVIQRNLEDPIAKLILKKNVVSEDIIKVDVKDNKLNIIKQAAG